MNQSISSRLSPDDLLAVFDPAQDLPARLGAAKALRESLRGRSDLEAFVPRVRSAYQAEADLAVATHLLKALNHAVMEMRHTAARDLDPPRVTEADALAVQDALEAMKSLHDKAGQAGAFEARYDVRGLISEGGMGRVFRAFDREAGRDVAIKYLAERFLKNPGVVERFRREYEVLRRLVHPNVVPVHDFVAGEGEMFIVMDFIEGPSLEQAVRSGSVTNEDFLTILDTLCVCFGHIHACGIVHRDIKPANILLQRQDGAIIPKVVDFGLAKIPESDGLTKVGTRMGTLEFLAPEQLANAAEARQRSDVYSLGVTAYWALSGGRLPVGDYLPLHKLGTGVEERVTTVIEGCLHKRPEGRWESMEALRQALSASGPETLFLPDEAEHERKRT